MIKRKHGVKILITMVVFLLVLITNSLPVLAINNVNEVTVLEDFVISLENPSDDVYNVNINITYYDLHGDIIYMKKVTKELSPFETTIIDAKDYYNSEETQKITVDIYDEESYTENVKKDVIGIVLGIVIGSSLFILIVMMGGKEKITLTTCCILIGTVMIGIPILAYILRCIL